MSDQVQENQEEKALQVFNFEGEAEVRAIIDKTGEPWFVAKDVAIALGYENPREAVRDHCKNYHNVGRSKSLPPETIKGLDPQTNIIKEPDLFRLILKSKLETAEKFQDWVVEEVLPAIRKHGYYGQQRIDEAYIPEASGYYSAERMAELLSVPLKVVNDYLTHRKWQAPTINKHGLLGYKPDGYESKQRGILQDAPPAQKGITFPRKIFWTESIFRSVKNAAEQWKKDQADSMAQIESK
jgi:prophage antirepressor-like protein